MILKNSITGVRIGAMDLPGLKKPCLVVDTTKGTTKYQHTNCIAKYASFNNDLAASEFMMILAEFVGANDE